MYYQVYAYNNHGTTETLTIGPIKVLQSVSYVTCAGVGSSGCVLSLVTAIPTVFNLTAQVDGGEEVEERNDVTSPARIAEEAYCNLTKG